MLAVVFDIPCMPSGGAIILLAALAIFVAIAGVAIFAVLSVKLTPLFVHYIWHWVKMATTGSGTRELTGTY